MCTLGPEHSSRVDGIKHCLSTSYIKNGWDLKYNLSDKCLLWYVTSIQLGATWIEIKWHKLVNFK